MWDSHFKEFREAVMGFVNEHKIEED